MLTVNYALIALTVIIFTVLKQLRIRLTLCIEVRTYRFDSIQDSRGLYIIIIVVFIQNVRTKLYYFFFFF